MATTLVPSPFRGEEAGRALAHLIYSVPPAAFEQQEEQDAPNQSPPPALPPTPSHPCRVAYRDLLRPVPPEGGDSIRVEYTCVHVASQYLVCGSNTGVVDIYRHDGAGGDCRLLKALVPPKGSQHTNVKVTCVKLDPAQRALAVGNILGAVNVLLLDFSEGRAQRMLHSHAHHQDAVRCLAWDDVGQRLYSGCDGGVIVESRLARQDDATAPATNGGGGASGGGGVTSSVGGLLGGRQFGPLLTLFQTCSSAVWHRESSELVQLTFYAMAGPLPADMQRKGDIPADVILLATHARRCNVHLLNRGLAKSLLYSIQVEGGGTAASGRTIYGATLQALMDSTGKKLEKLHLYVSRPHGKFWIVDLGSANAVKTLAPTLVVVPLPGEPEGEDKKAKEGLAVTAQPPASVAAALGGRLMLAPFPAPAGDCLVSWTHTGGLSLISLDHGQAVPLWTAGIHDLATLKGKGAVLTLVLLHGREKAVGMLEVGLVPEGDVDNDARKLRHAVTVLQRAWRGLRASRAEAMREKVQELLDAISEAEARSQERYTLLFDQRRQHEVGHQQIDPQAQALLEEVEAVCANAKEFLEKASSTPAVGEGSTLEGGGDIAALDSTSLTLVEMVDKLLVESQRVLASPLPHAPPTPPPVTGALDSESTEAEASPETEEEGMPVIYSRVGRRWKERQEEAATAVVESSRSVVVGVKEIEGDEAVNVGSAISALAALEYEVRLVASSGLGLDLAFVGNGVVVRELAFLADGRPSPAQLCGRIRPGDALLAVNSVALEPLALKDKLAVLLALAGEHDTEIALRFMAKEASSWTRSLIGLGLGAAGGAEGGAQKEETNPFLSMVEPSTPSHAQHPRPPLSSPSATPASLSMPSAAATAQEQQRAMEKMVELGLAAPKPGQSLGADQLRQQQSVVQQFLTSTLLPWKTRFWEDGGKGGGGDLPGLGRTHAGMASGRKKWGEFGQSDMSLGLVLAPEEMESDLDRIARDVRTVWTTEERASESRFYDDDHHFAALLGQARAASESHLPLKVHKRLVAERRLGRRGDDAGAGRGKRDIAREYLGLLYFKDLLKSSVARGQAAAAAQGEKGDKPRRVAGHQRVDSVDISPTSSFLLSKPTHPPPPPMQVYLEAVPLTDVLAELGGGAEVEVEGGEEESQDLDAAMEVLSRVLEATLAEMMGGAEEKEAAAFASPLLPGGQPWPPIQLTHVTGMAVAVQQAHAILGSSETMLQEWLRCFQPLPPSQRHMIWESSASFLNQHIHPDDAEMIRQHHLLTCELVTLYFQMHTVWPLLEKAIRRPEGADAGGGGRWGGGMDGAGDGGAGTEEVRLRLSWGREAAEGEDAGDVFDAALGVLHVGSRRGSGRPTQWQEDEALVFLEEYGAYVMLEGVVKACLARGFERALWFLLRDLGPQEERFQQAEKALAQGLKANTGDEAALVRQVKETEYPLSLAVALLPEVVASSSFATPAMVAELHRAFFPDLRPWLIRSILAAREKEKEKVDPYGSHSFAAAALIITHDVDEAWWSCLRAVGFQGQQQLTDATRSSSPRQEERSRVQQQQSSPPSSEEASLPSVPKAAMGVPALQAALRHRLKLLRRAVSAGDLMTRIQTHIWDNTAASSASSGLNIVPPSLLGIALLEIAASGRQRSSTGATWLEEEENAEEIEEQAHRPSPAVASAGEVEEGRSYVVDPVEGQGGIGMALNPKNKYVCGVCQLPCCGNGVGGGRATRRHRRRNADRLEEGGRGSGQGGEDEEENGGGRESGEGKKTLILFTCNHMYHSACLPEQACVLCLRENFSSF